MEPVDRQLIARLDAAPSVVCLPTAAGQEVDRDQREVMGSGGVTVWNHHERARYTAGQFVLWPNN
ncbi:MAG: hypothetical protein A2W35_04745 [Chloroflexi bacterium RBG_16_57_11]|nr:MAG: hypothetical protein A2W35_04745 [Chloroflexi bacterium RBG_16_57_11]